MKDIRIAAVICSAKVGETRANLDGMVKWVRAAGRRQAALVCFPELNISGYSTHSEIKKAAEPVPGSVARELADLAAAEKIAIMAGVAEKDKDGRIFASHLLVRPDGTIGVYRKLHIAPPERAVFSCGDKIPLFQVDGVTLGVQLCYDAHFPVLSTCMAEKGAELIIIPHASPRGTGPQKMRSWMRHLPARAYDNSLFIFAFNQTGSNGRGLLFPGIAILIGPDGNVIQKKSGSGEGMLVVDLKAAELARVRNNRMHFFLPNRRTDLVCAVCQNNVPIE